MHLGEGGGGGGRGESLHRRGRGGVRRRGVRAAAHRRLSRARARSGRARVHDDWPDNLAGISESATGDAKAGLRPGRRHRGDASSPTRAWPACPSKARGVLASHDGATGLLTVWLSTQVPFGGAGGHRGRARHGGGACARHRPRGRRRLRRQGPRRTRRTYWCPRWRAGSAVPSSGSRRGASISSPRPADRDQAHHARLGVSARRRPSWLSRRSSRGITARTPPSARPSPTTPSTTSSAPTACPTTARWGATW